MSTILLAGILMLGGCMSEEPIQPSNESFEDPNFVSLAEALESADTHFGIILKTKNTRGARKVKSTEFLNSSTRNSGSNYYGFYIVNYDNGFALLSADKRRNPVYAISDEGAFELADTSKNDGLKWYVSSY